MFYVDFQQLCATQAHCAAKPQIRHQATLSV